LVLITFSIAFAQKKQEIISLGQETHVVINNFYNESKIYIYNSKRKLVLYSNFTSEDREHGYKIIKTEWTANSNCFVFTVGSSGGHQPWYSPIFIYSVTDKKLLSIDEILGAVTSDFKLTLTDSIETRVLKKNSRYDKIIQVKISDLFLNSQ